MKYAFAIALLTAVLGGCATGPGYGDGRSYYGNQGYSRGYDRSYDRGYTGDSYYGGYRNGPDSRYEGNAFRDHGS
jgi:hypothetical protein